MASVTQWAKWREEYLSGLKRIIDDAPFYLSKNVVESEGVAFDLNKAKLFVNDAIQKGLIDTTSSEYFIKAYSFATIPASAEDIGEKPSFEYGDGYYQEFKKGLDDDIETVDAIHLISFGLVQPLVRACYYVSLNHPLASKTVLAGICKELEQTLKWDTLRLSREDLFAFLQGMTPYGLDKLLTEIKCSTNYFDDLFESIQKGDYSEFKSLCREGEIELSEVAEIAGYIQSALGKGATDLDEINESSKTEDSSEQNEVEKSYLLPFITMVGGKTEETIDFLYNYHDGDGVVKLYFPKANEEEINVISGFAKVFLNLYPFIECFDDEELNEIDRLFNNPLFDPFIKVSQLYYAAFFNRLPKAVRICFTPEEQDEIANAFFKSDDEKESTVFALPADFFDLPLDRSAGDEYFDVEYDVEKGGTKRFTRLLNYIASQGYIEYSNRSKQLLAYILTGRWKPADYQRGETMTWHDYGHEGKELCYIIKSLVASDQGKKATKYDKMHKLFTGPNWSNSVPDKDQGNNAQKKFKEALNDLYPDICKL